MSNNKSKLGLLETDMNFLTVCYKDLISCCQLQQKKRSSIRSPSPTMFSVALLLLLAAGSCESH
ncbi:hypothetical protein F7725_003633 [Dissostichus mawsoni]|uniref:Uncharacterized protein n=1 Tax=Dissostichus mawsoni TaxID=36200 RepID=A0A7J5YAW8_DISMA|nr:hypothetical protein F7725_003633 [Dissostichus mawsoni]